MHEMKAAELSTVSVLQAIRLVLHHRQPQRLQRRGPSLRWVPKGGGALLILQFLLAC